ncbi:MAG: TonB-dependent receptor [Candidatus Eremiobacteraeota bacterium]|nr:TonB-dependent receptor [Candidatus Eremiobacteraeota bacterium]
MRLWLIAALIGADFLAFGFTCARAGTTGAILGFVTDSDLRPLAGVEIAVVSPSEHAVTVTQANGFYSFNGLALDTYAVTFSKDGFLSRVIPDVTTVQDQSIRVNASLSPSFKTLARINVRSSTSVVQPTVTGDAYVISQQRLSDINGTPQDLLGFFNGSIALPGFTPDAFGIPIIHGGAINDVGNQLDGVDNTDPVSGNLLNAGSLNGVHSVQLLTGGYDVSEGNTNSGVINEVIKRGSYPTEGRLTARISGPIYGHELSFDFGGATPTNRFSYYLSFGGQRDGRGNGNGTTILPLSIDGYTFTALNDEVINLFYHFGRGESNELQFLTNVSNFAIRNGYLVDPVFTPYASNNGNVQAAFDPFNLGQFSTFESSYLSLFPGQVAEKQNINAPDSFSLNTLIRKINFKRQLTSSSFVQARLMRTMGNEISSVPYGGGSFREIYTDLQTTGTGEAVEYTNQLNSRTELSVGATGFYYANRSSAESQAGEPFIEPLEALGCASAANARGAQQAGGCYIAPFNAALNAALGLGLPTDVAHAPLLTYVGGGGIHANIPLHRWNAYIRDRWQPNARLTLTLGLRWDKESIPLPPDAALQNTTYFIDDTRPAGCGAPPAVACDIVTRPGQAIGSDVTQPQQISPRLAASYEMSARDVVRFSFGRNIEFEPLNGIVTAFSPPRSLQKCDIQSGCFIPLPGYGTTNRVSNLYDQVVLDLTTHAVAQYSPVLPQTAVNVDFSYEHEFGRGIELRVTPYYRKGMNYAVGSAPLLFTLKSGTPIFGTPRTVNAGINKSAGVEFVLQRNAQYGLSGILDATYDNTLANYDGEYFPGVNNAALAAGHFFHITYIAPVSGLLNLTYNSRAGFHAGLTASFESGFPYGVGKKTFVFGPNGVPVQVLNTDVASGGAFSAYYVTNPANRGTPFAPNIVASRGTPEGDDPGTLSGPAIATVNVTISHQLGKAPRNTDVGIRVKNLFGNYSPTGIPPNPYYGFSGFGNNGLPSGVNPNACAPGQTFGCEPFRYNYSPFPYEQEQSGPPRLYTFFISAKY